MAELETFCGYHSATDGTEATWLTDALFVYENGGGGKCTQADVDDTNNPWCTEVDGAKGNSLKGAVGDAADKTVIRTLQGFATKDYSTDKLTGVSDNGWYDEPLPKIYKAYWTANGMTAEQANVWADTFITKDYSTISKDSGTNQLIKKGANYQAVWMYVLHELEDAIGDCYSDDITNNDGTPTGGAPHAWDEGWAFYAGSTVGATAADAVTDDGTLIWELAEKRGTDFGTTHSTGPATVNVNLLAEFIKGRDLIIAAKCAEAEPIIDNIITQMSIPLIQGTLKYAYSSDPLTATGKCTADAGKDAMTASDDCVKGWAEGWAFAAAILPRINECSSTAPVRAEPNFSRSSRDLTPDFHAGGDHDQNEPGDHGDVADGGRLRGGQGGGGVDVRVPGHHVRRRRRVRGHHGVLRCVRRRRGPRARARRGRRGRGRGAPPRSLRTPVPTKFPAPFPAPRPEDSRISL